MNAVYSWVKARALFQRRYCGSCASRLFRRKSAQRGYEARLVDVRAFGPCSFAPFYLGSPIAIRQQRWIRRFLKSAGTVWRLISRIVAPRISASASLKRRKFVEKKISPPGAISSTSRLSNSTWFRWMSQ